MFRGLIHFIARREFPLLHSHNHLEEVITRWPEPFGNLLGLLWGEILVVHFTSLPPAKRSRKPLCSTRTKLDRVEPADLNGSERKKEFLIHLAGICVRLPL